MGSHHIDTNIDITTPTNSGFIIIVLITGPFKLIDDYLKCDSVGRTRDVDSVFIVRPDIFI